MARHQEAPPARGPPPAMCRTPPLPHRGNENASSGPHARTGNVNNPRQNWKQEERTRRPWGALSKPPWDPRNQRAPPSPDANTRYNREIQTINSNSSSRSPWISAPRLDPWNGGFENGEITNHEEKLNGNNKLKTTGPPNTLQPNLTQQPFTYTLCINITPCLILYKPACVLDITMPSLALKS